LETPFARVFDVAFAPATEYDTHHHEEGYLCLILDGGYDEWPAGGGRASVTTGSLVAYAAGSAHATRTGACGARILHVAYPGSPAMIERASGTAIGILWQLVRVVERSARAGADDTDALQAACLTSELWADAAEPLGGASLDRLRDAVRESFAERVTLEGLARMVDRHPAHVARALRARWGMTVGEYVRRTRVAEAVRRLRTTDDALSTVAYCSGFADQSHMGRCVRHYTGVAPLAVREGRLR
jgi:AraC family transcriptional regulator